MGDDLHQHPNTDTLFVLYPPNHLYLKHKEIKPEGLASKEAPSGKEHPKGVNGLP